VTNWHKTGSAHPFKGPELACGISERIAKQSIRGWVYRNHQEYCKSTAGQKHVKGFLPETSANSTTELLKLSKNQL
jgi:hypothetical protein